MHSVQGRRGTVTFARPLVGGSGEGESSPGGEDANVKLPPLV